MDGLFAKFSTVFVLMGIMLDPIRLLALDCDLVDLGKHGQTATEDLLLGSVTKHMLAEGSADMLVSTAR